MNTIKYFLSLVDSKTSENQVKNFQSSNRIPKIRNQTSVSTRKSEKKKIVSPVIFHAKDRI